MPATPSSAAAPGEALIRLSRIDKRFGALEALRGLDLHVPAGSVTVLLGPSGCGKSTLLHLVNGLLAPDRGEVTIGGTPVRPDTVLGLRQRMGYVIQGGGLFPHLSARDNVELMARWLGWSGTAARTRTEELRELTRLPASALERTPRELSGGQAQRVALMRALMLDPEVLLLDEPLGALDPLVRFELQVQLREIFRALGKTVLMVTHDLAEAAYFADTVVLMRSGAIVQTGTPSELIERPRDDFVRSFVQAQRLLHGVAT